MTAFQAFITGLDGGPWYTRRQAARLVGVTPDAILRVGQSPLHPEFIPAAAVEYAGSDVALYTYEQIVQFRAHFQRPNAGAGRPRIWSLTESANRRKQYDLIRYYRRRANRMKEEGNLHAANAAHEKAEHLQRDYDAQEPGVSRAS